MSAPVFDLAVQGIAYFNQTALNLQQRKVARDPLRGIVDGSNKIYLANYAPMVSSGSSPLQIYVSGALVTGTADYETGEIELATAPAAQPKATYTHTPYTGRQVLRFMLNGLRELERRWLRGWRAVDAGGSLATEDSLNLYVADADGQDPVCGSLVFSESFTQIGALLLAAQYAFVRDVGLTAAQTDFMVRETARGMTVDKQKRPANLRNAVADLSAALDDAIGACMEESLGTVRGGFIANPVTFEYAAVLNWQAASKAESLRDQMPYHLARRGF